ncbi:hypothetical protein ACWERV_23265 [Streptomyces sp. NPDC004031]
MSGTAIVVSADLETFLARQTHRSPDKRLPSHVAAQLAAAPTTCGRYPTTPGST